MAAVSSLDVCKGGGIFDDYQGLFLSQGAITNAMEFQPTSDEYYADKVQPRVTPWAATCFTISIAVLLGFVIWRALILCICARHVKQCACEDFCQPVKLAPDRVLRSRLLFALRVIVTVLLGLVGAFCCWGLATAGPMVVENFWSQLDVVSEQASSSITSASTTANLTEHMSREGLSLVDYVGQFMTVDAADDPFLCLRESMTTVPGMLEEVFGSLKEAERLLFHPGQLLPSGQAAMSAFSVMVEDKWIDLLAKAAWTAGDTSTLVQQIRNSLGDSIEAYEDLVDGGSSGRAQDLIDANGELDFASDIKKIDSTMAKLDQFDQLLGQDSPLEAAVAELKSYAEAQEDLESNVLPAALSTVNSASKLSNEAMVCIDDVAPRVGSITSNVFKLPGNVDEAIMTLKTDLSSVATTKDVVGEAMDEIDGLVLAGNIQTLVAQLNAANDLISPALTTVPLRMYLTGADKASGLRGALVEAEQFTELSNVLGKKYINDPDLKQFNMFSVTVTPALSSLRKLQEMVEVGSPSWDGVALSLNRIRAFQEALKEISEDQLDVVFGRLKQLMAGSNLQKLEELRDSIHQIIESASVEIDAVVKEAITQGASFMVEVKTTLEDLQDASKSVLGSKTLPGMVRATNLMELARQQMNQSMEELSAHRDSSIALDEARLQASFGLFGSIMVICFFVVAGVWLGVPFLYGFFTLGLLVTMLLSIMLFVPYGTAVVVGSDSCQIMEEKLLDLAGSSSLDPETQQLASAALNYYVFGQPNGTFEDFVSAEVGVDMRKTVQSMLYYRNRMIIAMETWQLAPVLYDKMASLIADVDNAVVSTGTTMSFFDYSAVSTAYSSMKAEVCCSVVGTAGMQWLFLLCVGVILLVASGFIFAFIHMMDHLEVHCKGWVSFLGLYRHPTQERPMGEFVLEDEAVAATLNKPVEEEVERTESVGKIQAVVQEVEVAEEGSDYWVSPPAAEHCAYQVHVHCHKVSFCADQFELDADESESEDPQLDKGGSAKEDNAVETKEMQDESGRNTQHQAEDQEQKVLGRWIAESD